MRRRSTPTATTSPRSRASANTAASCSRASPPTSSRSRSISATRALLDLAVDQSPGGLELVPGVVRYTYRGNWKLQLENSLDAYHFTSTHPSYLRLLERRSTQSERSDVPKAIWQSERNDEERMGSFGLRNGHAMVWTTSPVEHHPLYAGREALVARVGAVRADWMMRTRQLNVFPNLQIASNAAL